ncbi:MAG: hypothetical protein GEV03_05605 [Streptosporangiales bacterium]|nr:hypothetical protein [Streptosporangiales bacterium]
MDRQELEAEREQLWGRLERLSKPYQQTSRSLNFPETCRTLHEAVQLYHDALDRHGGHTRLILGIAQLLCDVAEDVESELRSLPDYPKDLLDNDGWTGYGPLDGGRRSWFRRLRS